MAALPFVLVAGLSLRIPGFWQLPALAALLLFAAGGAVWYLKSQNASSPVASAASAEEVKAKLVAALATLRVDANVPGARVSLDGQERGTTPLELPNLSTGRRELEVSAEGYETRRETVELENGERDVKIDLLPPATP